MKIQCHHGITDGWAGPYIKQQREFIFKRRVSCMSPACVPLTQQIQPQIFIPHLTFPEATQWSESTSTLDRLVQAPSAEEVKWHHWQPITRTQRSQKPLAEKKKTKKQLPSIFSTALEQFKLLLWHPVLYLMSTSPWWWVGDLYFRPAVLPDVVNIQFVIQVRLLERKRKYTSPQLSTGQGQAVQAQPPLSVISESGEEGAKHQLCKATAHLPHQAGKEDNNLLH